MSADLLATWSGRNRGSVYVELEALRKRAQMEWFLKRRKSYTGVYPRHTT